jgi:hypothetical protein
MEKEVQQEINSAVDELTRLHYLANEARWYSFELACRGWKHPWHESVPDSMIELLTLQYDGKRHTLNCWYKGTLEAAPTLPWKVINDELEDAKKYLEEVMQVRYSISSWAPGGYKYDEMMHTSPHVATYQAWYGNK